MPYSTASHAALESAQCDFSHSLLAFRDRVLQRQNLRGFLGDCASRKIYKFCDGPGVVVGIG